MADLDARERPILFSGAMVRAILDGRKTQTRRLLNVPPPPGTTQLLTGIEREHDRWWPTDGRDYTGDAIRCPYGAPGDRLWVRETFAAAGQLVAYDADGWRGAVCDDGAGGRLRIPHGFVSTTHDDAIRRGNAEKLGARFGLQRFGGRWRPSIHMPRWASRLTLEITGVRVQRLQDITEEDAIAEGVRLAPDQFAPSAVSAFAFLWDEINADRAPWASNPWVWAISFRRLP